MSEQQLDIMERIGRLLSRRLHDELDMADQSYLDEWLSKQSPETHEFIGKITDKDEVEKALGLYYSIDVDAALADVEKKVQAGIYPAEYLWEDRPRRHGIRRLLYWAVAAAIILAIGLSLLFTHRQKAPLAVPAISQRFKNEVAPGGDKAVLELADGSKIVLDNASNGELAKQGHTRVVKLDNGQLAYRAGSSASQAPSYNTVSTPRGGQYQVTLPDGSKVWLNAASTLKFPTAFVGNDRVVDLTGEAYFQIAKHATMPFRVKVNHGIPGHDSLEIEVLGTEFDVMAYGDESDARTTLINGAVKVSAGAQERVLQPGQQVRVTSHSTVLVTGQNFDLDEVTAWKNGLFQFQDASIESIMRQVARWYDVDVVYDGKVDQQFIGKIPRQVNITTLLKILESTGWVHFKVDGKKVTVSR